MTEGILQEYIYIYILVSKKKNIYIYIFDSLLIKITLYILLVYSNATTLV